MSKVAIVTGGASGIGLAVATSLSQDPSEKWSVHIFDIDDAAGTPAGAGPIANATFHRCDVTDYASLASEFGQVFRTERRLDFVHANAGIIGPAGFKPADSASGAGGEDEDDKPPPMPDMKVIDVNLKGVIGTSWLAMHYFRLTGRTLQDESWEGNLVMTASISSLYATYGAPMYGAAKYGILGLMRSLAAPAHRDDRVRVNCVCPGIVRTGMTAQAELPDAILTPMDKVVGAVRTFLAGKGIVDSAGVKVEDGRMFGRALEVSKATLKFQEMPEYSDPVIAMLMGSRPPPEGAA